MWTIIAIVAVPAVNAGEARQQVKPLGTLGELSEVSYTPAAFSPDGKVLACPDVVIKDNGEVVTSVKLWDVAKRKVIAILPGEFAYSVAFSPDGKTLAASSGKSVTLWDVATRKQKASLKGHAGNVRTVAFSPDGKTLAVGGEGKSSGAAGKGELKLWDLSTRKEKASLGGHLGPVFAVAFSPNGKLLASGSGAFAVNGSPGAGEITLWEVATGTKRVSLKGGFKLKLTDKVLASLRMEKVPEAVLKKLATWGEKEFRTEEDFEKELTKVLGKDKHEVAFALGDKLYYAGPYVVWSVAFSPDGKTLASGDVYGCVLLWDVKTGNRSATLQVFDPYGKEEDRSGALAVAFSRDGATLVAGTGGIKLWDINSGKKAGGVKGPPVWSLAVSPDGRTVASVESKRGGVRDAGTEGAIRLWELIPYKKVDR
jgi:WD40 repeat protein